MKKYGLYILAFLLLVLIGTVIVRGGRARPRRFDERITLRLADKIPYGTSATKELLPGLFPGTRIYTSRQDPQYSDSLGSGGNDALVIFTSRFDADDEEMQSLLHFVENGNQVLLVANTFSDETQRLLGFDVSEHSSYYQAAYDDDSLALRLNPAVFGRAERFAYPGRKVESSFYKIDSARTRVLGFGSDGRPDFIQLSTGKGNLFVHAAPLAFTNYFVLHRNNNLYLARALSVIPASVRRLEWNEYYLSRRPSASEKDPGWLRVLFRYPPFKWALLTGSATLVLCVLLGMRRRQRQIPLIRKPRNESLDFVKTLGRLYYDRRDHRNLAQKIGTYFLDHVRSRYKLPTQERGEAFVAALHYKSGYDRRELERIVGFINALDNLPAISEQQLFQFHKLVEAFYQNT